MVHGEIRNAQVQVQSDVCFVVFALSRLSLSSITEGGPSHKKGELIQSSNQFFFVYVMEPGTQWLFQHNHHLLSTWQLLYEAFYILCHDLN